MGEVFAKVTNPCGSIEERLVVNVTGGRYTVYPNPVSDILTIEIDESQIDDQSKSENVEIRLYDKLMSLKKHETSKSSIVTLNLNNLKPDVYILQLKLGNEIFEEKIIVSER